MHWQELRTDILIKPLSTPKRAEIRTKKMLEKEGYTVIRTDYKNNMPDFMTIKDGEIFFVEVKRYITTDNLYDAMQKYFSNKKQANQRKKIMELIKAEIDVYFHFYTIDTLYILKILDIN